MHVDVLLTGVDGRATGKHVVSATTAVVSRTFICGSCYPCPNHRLWQALKKALGRRLAATTEVEQVALADIARGNHREACSLCGVGSLLSCNHPESIGADLVGPDHGLGPDKRTLRRLNRNRVGAAEHHGAPWSLGVAIGAGEELHRHA